MSRKLIDWLLYRFTNEALYESISGDLEELDEINKKKYSKSKSKRLYIINALAFFRYHRLRSNNTTTNNMSLVKNYLKVSLRDLLNHKTYSSINLIGLVSAVTVTLFILQYVVFELGFDTFHSDYDRIYRVVNDRYQNGQLIQHGTITYPTIGPALERDFPEVESYTRMTFNNRNYIGYDEQLYLTEQFIFADEHFLTFFSFELLHGNPETALNEPFTAVLSESFAEILLGNDLELQSIVGKNIEIYDRPVKITGIVEDAPLQSHLQYDMLLSYNTFVELSGGGADSSWDWSDFYHYVKLKENTSLVALNDKLNAFGERYFKKGEVSGSVEKFTLQSLNDAHFDPDMQYESGLVVNGKVVWTLLVIAGFILLVAWINYINLTTSRVLQRVKEVGVRKSVGANRSNIVLQFIVETFLINVIAISLALALVWTLQPFFNQLTGVELSLTNLFSASLMGVRVSLLLLIFIMVSLVIISLYPASLLASFQARDVINGKYKITGKVAWLRKAMVTFQFLTAIILINGAISISDQVNYMMNKDLGLDIENTLIVYGPAMEDWDSAFFNNVNRFQNEVGQLSGVKNVTTSNRVAGSRMGKLFQVRNNSKPEMDNLSLNWMGVGYNYEALYDLEIIEGRPLKSTDYNLSFNNEQTYNLLINAAAVSYLGFASSEEAVGGELTIYNRQWRIVGVVQDFHQMTLHESIEPLVLQPFRSTEDHYSIKLESAASPGLISEIEKAYNDVFPGNYFDYYYLKDSYKRYYQSEERLSIISQVFTILSIVMVILGLYGLTAMTLEKKVKEIGIRKVLGAQVSQLLFHLSKGFVWLLILAIALGIPVSLFLIDLWKTDFAYISSTSSTSIVLTCLLISICTCIPIILHLRKIASNDPIHSLRNE